VALSNLVPTAFQWFGSCEMVYLAGSFNEWKERIPLHRCASGRDWAVVLNLPPGDYTYKYVVQNGADEGLTWQHAHDQPAGRDSMGNINNFISECDQAVYEGEGGLFDDDGGYAQHVPEELVEVFFAPEPPMLPPFLEPLHLIEPAGAKALLESSHCSLQHLCVGMGAGCSSDPLPQPSAPPSAAAGGGDGGASMPAAQTASPLPPAVTLSVKQRHRGKFVELLLIKPVPLPRGGV